MQKINLQLFAKVIDLSEELSSENPRLKLGEKEFEIDTRFKTILELDKLFKEKDGDMEFVQKFLSQTLGKKAATELLAMNLHISSYKKIIKVIGEELQGSTDDESTGSSI